MVEATAEQLAKINSLLDEIGCDVFVRNSTIGMNALDVLQNDLNPPRTLVINSDIRTDKE